MPTHFEVWIPGKAKSERKRQRFIKNSDGQMVPGQRTDEPDRKDWKTWVRERVIKACRKPFDGPVRLTAYVVCTKPKSYPKKPTVKFPWPWAKMTKPDAGNYTKLLEDAINGIKYTDDGHIVDSRSVKVFGSEEGVLLVIEVVTEADNAQIVEYVERRVKALREIEELRHHYDGEGDDGDE